MSLWIFLAVGALTLALRAAFILTGPWGWERHTSPYLQRVPAAVLPALAVSTLLAQSAEPDALARGIAAVAALAIAARTRSLLITLGAGMLALHILRAVGV